MTDESANLKVAQALGELQGTVKHLVLTWERQDEAATQGRRDLHQRVNAMSTQLAGLTAAVQSAATLGSRVTAVENKVASHEQILAQIGPLVASHQTALDKSRGAIWVGRGAWGLALLFIGALLAKLGWK